MKYWRFNIFKYRQKSKFTGLELARRAP